MADQLDAFLAPLRIDIHRLHALAHRFSATFRTLAATSSDQFLPTPISVLPTGRELGRFLAIDIGGTNLRVAITDLCGSNRLDDTHDAVTTSGAGQCVRRQFEKVWPIAEHLKNEKAEDLFAWIGQCIAEVVGAAAAGATETLSLGVTFSFPMIQRTLSDATLMSMGKGFAITSNLDLAKQLMDGYEKANPAKELPDLKLTAITNDSVATLICLAYRLNGRPNCRAVMGMIVGTGTNATIPLTISSLHASKQPTSEQMMSPKADDAKVVVNTEWSINGAAGPLRELSLITRWDTVLDAAGEAPGFQPFEYMTAGRYLGELGRIIAVDYFTRILNIARNRLPPKLLERNGLRTALLGNLHTAPHDDAMLVMQQLSAELPPAASENAWAWTPETALVVQKIAKAIEERAAGMTAAAIIGLLACAGEVKLAAKVPVTSSKLAVSSETTVLGSLGPVSPGEKLIVGFTGGCISNFQDYLADCQDSLDKILEVEGKLQASAERHQVVLEPCNDGGIDGAGILAGTVAALAAR